MTSKVSSIGLKGMEGYRVQVEVKREIPIDTAFIGALSLDGSVVSGEGILPAVIAAKGLGIKEVFLPDDPVLPLHMLQDINCIVVCHIEEVVQHLEGQESMLSHPHYSQKII